MTTTPEFIQGVQIQAMLDDDTFATSSDALRLVAAELGGIFQEPWEPVDAGIGIWLVSLHHDTFDTLVEVGWIGIDNGGDSSFEAEWPL